MGQGSTGFTSQFIHEGDDFTRRRSPVDRRADDQAVGGLHFFGDSVDDGVIGKGMDDFCIDAVFFERIGDDRQCCIGAAFFAAAAIQ